MALELLKATVTMQKTHSIKFPLFAMPLALAFGCAPQDGGDELLQERADNAEIARQAVLADANVQDMLSQMEFVGCKPDLSAENLDSALAADSSQDMVIAVERRCWENDINVGLVMRVREGNFLYAHAQMQTMLPTEDPELKQVDPVGFLGFIVAGGELNTFQNYREFRRDLDNVMPLEAAARVATADGESSYEARVLEAGRAAPIQGSAQEEPAGDYDPGPEATGSGDFEAPSFFNREYQILSGDYEGGQDVDDACDRGDETSCLDCMACVTNHIHKGVAGVCSEAAQDYLDDRDDEISDLREKVQELGGVFIPSDVHSELCNIEYPGYYSASHPYFKPRPAGCDIAIASSLGIAQGSALEAKTTDCVGMSGHNPMRSASWSQSVCGGGACERPYCDFYSYGDSDCDGKSVKWTNIVDAFTGDVILENIEQIMREYDVDRDQVCGHPDVRDVARCQTGEEEEVEIETPYCGRLDDSQGDRAELWVCASRVNFTDRYVQNSPSDVPDSEKTWYKSNY